MSKLPDKPSTLIRLALADLEKTEKDPEHYHVQMLYHWHTPGTRDERCTVCFSGVVMAQTLKADPKKITWPSHFIGNGDERKLLALNQFRMGFISEGFYLMDIKAQPTPPSHIADRVVPAYDTENPVPFKEAMAAMADDLEKEDL